MVASVESTSTTSLPRGMGGRIEDAFAGAKERGEAAFVSFVTAGYPSYAGRFSSVVDLSLQWVVFGVRS